MRGLPLAGRAAGRTAHHALAAALRPVPRLSQEPTRGRPVNRGAEIARRSSLGGAGTFLGVQLLAVLLSLLLPGRGAAEPNRPGAARPAPSAFGHGSVTEGMDCAACHTPDSWKQVVQATDGAGFDHSKTGFPLT